ncbi:MAG: hypothetical protein Q8S02_07905, partial [Hydrogenophaga sp.]|nr:hypothetical protein [Hydrogenophaga sp.]
MKKYQGLGFLGPSNLFLLFWLFGVILPILPFLAETDGFSLMWPYVFNDKLDSLASALIVYTGVLISFFLGHGIAKKFLSTKRNSSIPVYVRGPSFELRATIVSIIGLLSIATLIHLVGGIDSWLQAGSNRIREFAGLNFI